MTEDDAIFGVPNFQALPFLRAKYVVDGVRFLVCPPTMLVVEFMPVRQQVGQVVVAEDEDILRSFVHELSYQVRRRARLIRLVVEIIEIVPKPDHSRRFAFPEEAFDQHNALVDVTVAVCSVERHVKRDSQ